ncbi:MAG: PEP/pyruvate-binding domain-containing protein [Anaerolineales bacterium]
MTLPIPSSDNVLSIYLTLSQYPILGHRIRSRMRREMFERGIISQEDFEAEARQKAIESQGREGLQNPFGEETSEVWERRLSRIRASLTDFYFAYNLPYADFERIIREILTERGRNELDFVWFNPELAPQDMLFEQAEMIAHMPEEERARYRPRLQEIKVVLIRTLVSDHLRYIKIARKWFKVADLVEIRNRKIGSGKIGGKAAGMVLALRILKETAPHELRNSFRIPESFFLGSDVFYNFMSLNGLMHWNDQKYKSEDEIRKDYPIVCTEFSKGQFPPEIQERLKELVRNAKKIPLIVRSSSLLEDNFGTSFAGKYESIFCPNQGTLEENLFALTNAISRVYASSVNPDALLYRHQNGLADYDERIAILIQHVEGEQVGRYYLPQGAGVAFSRNLYRWSPQIRQEDGFLRLVWGLGTRAVDQIADDYPRLVALSHPKLHPTADVKSIRRYSQQSLDVIDLEANQFCSIPASEVLNPRYPPIRYIVQVDQDGYLGAMRSNMVEPEKLVITYEGLLSRTPFPARMRDALELLETHYNSPVDTEFTVKVLNPNTQKPDVRITLLQCRPQSHIQETGQANLPRELLEKDIIFSTQRMVPQGVIEGIRYVLFVSPEGYFSISTEAERTKLIRAIGQLNAALEDETFIAVGPGRWGTSTPDLGVHVAYGDIYNARALVELSGESVGPSPEPSFGTHFFQDLMEAHIYPLAVFLDDKDIFFNHDFFYKTPNKVLKFISINKRLTRTLRLLAVEDSRPGHHMDLVMDGQKGRAVAYLVPEEE